MIHKIAFALMIGLAIWTIMVAVRIERLNAEADYYLPGRHGDTIGKWRVSQDMTPRDRLRGLISSHGILQYPSGVLLIIGSIYFTCRQRSIPSRLLSVSCGVIGLAALGLAIYREYFPSLGW